MIWSRLVVPAALAIAAGVPGCGARSSLTAPAVTQAATCGDGHVDAGEESGAWSVDVIITLADGIDTLEFVDGDGTRVPLSVLQTVTLTASDLASGCRADCTLARCGDGTLDAGEVCDDGNTQGGDGCAADCKSVP